MKIQTIILTAALAAIPTIGLADKQGPDREGRGPKREKIRELVLEKFDKDGDGKLSEEERAAVKAARENRKSELIKNYDTDGNGKLSKEERKAAMESFKAKMLKEFDADGDGELSKEERKTARKTMRERGERPPFRPRGRKGRRGGPPVDGGEGLPSF